MDSIVRVSGPQAGFIVNQNATVTIRKSCCRTLRRTRHTGTGTLETAHHQVFKTLCISTVVVLPNYIITQTVTDTMGCRSSISTSDLFKLRESTYWQVKMKFAEWIRCIFIRVSQNYASYLWDFGDSTTSTSAAPNHIYTQEGVYHVTLIVTDNAGCTQSFEINPPITVSLPVASFYFQWNTWL